MKRTRLFNVPVHWLAIALLVALAAPASGQNVFEVIREGAFSAGQVRIGEGQTGENIDLRIIDPNFSNSADEESLFFDASAGVLRLGSGTAGEAGDDGDLQIYDEDGVQTFNLDGDPANATQASFGNGFVKAWVKVHHDGSVAAGDSYNVSSVSRSGLGTYWVTMSAGLLSRPMTATLDGHLASPSTGGISIGFPDDFHPGTKNVLTYTAAGTLADRSFTLVVY